MKSLFTLLAMMAAMLSTTAQVVVYRAPEPMDAVQYDGTETCYDSIKTVFGLWGGTYDVFPSPAYAGEHGLYPTDWILQDAYNNIFVMDTTLFENFMSLSLNTTELNLIAGDGIEITGTWPNITISIEEPELMPMAPNTPMKHGLEPFVMKVEYYDMQENLLPYEPSHGHFVVWNYMTNETIKKFQVEKP